MRSNRLVALVTGASGGIGRACAERLAAAGLTVYGTSRHPARYFRDKDFRLLRLDVRQDASVRACVNRVISECGHIDVLVNNAGIALEGAVEETSLDEIRDVFETNLFGAVRMMKAVLPIMRKRHRGRIINIGSIAGIIPMPYSAAYCASKHALHGVSESLDHEVRNFGIRVIVVQPGFIKTDIVGHAPEAASAFEPYKSARMKPAQIFRQQIETGADPDVVARSVVNAALSRFPRLHYFPDGVASLTAFVHDALPSPLFDFVFRSQMHIDDSSAGEKGHRRLSAASSVSRKQTA